MVKLRLTSFSFVLHLSERDNPFESDDPRVAHIDFLVGRFDLASGQGCTSPGC